MGEEKRSGEDQAKEENRESSDWSEREVERLNERCRKPMKNNFHRWGGGRASIADEPLLPGESPMSTLCTGFERWGMRLHVNERFREASFPTARNRSEEHTSELQSPDHLV